ncbi:Major facilitator superfamily domain, general substrate transporter [Plasmopara halstedii]|uniref:Major facilitator superfamily domain, general substrate transporter n=1 Tax=Plasmopara halstedii TaxID=4781 RepID=A0A0P1B0R1_PLAHL|nr:Major facilitator superfamily domain, general substrate transporter [Plasmopara halstedii]CEG48335.1 Major facilitator superfamily domain, general substrate transporter [Plasmopara halstedii]|eukprot:XP_024584704.1 Major facilitator superfamily domain, general substrate transporter [Plasmopara halstedii]
MEPKAATSPPGRLPRLNLDETLDASIGSLSSPDNVITSSTEQSVDCKAKSTIKALSPLKESAKTRLRSETSNVSQFSKYRQFCNWVQHLRDTFGTAFLVLSTIVYVVQGFSSFTVLAINYFFKDNLGLQPIESQLLHMITKIPWRVKPVYGILSDSLPLFGYHRKSYIMLCSVLQTTVTLVMAVPDLVTTPTMAVLMLMLQSLSVAVIDVVIDARVVEISRLDPENGPNDLQSLSWVATSLGGMLGAFLSGPATACLGVRGVFCAAALGPITTLLLSMFMEESQSTLSKRDFVSSATKQLRQLKIAISTPVVWMCALWVFISHAISPAYTQILFFFSTDVLHFTPEFLGTVSAIGFIFLMAGTMLYNTYFTNVSFRRIFFVAQLCLALVSLVDVVLVTRLNLEIGIPDKAFVLGDHVVADVIGRLKTMPIMVLCAKLCPRGIEGTLFALLMSISNLSYSVSEFWGAFVCDWMGISKDEYEMLWLAIVLRSALKVVPIFFLFLIPSSDPQDLIDKMDLGSPVRANLEDDNDTVGTIRENQQVDTCSPSEQVVLNSTSAVIV